MACDRTPLLAGFIPTMEMVMTAWENMMERNELKQYISAAHQVLVQYYKKIDESPLYTTAMSELSYLQESFLTRF